ncbi:MAG: hypothetical protein ACR2QM_00015, partial [Longimicrobiales bacterium]
PLGVAGAVLMVLAVWSYVSSPIYLVGRSDIVILPLLVLGLAMAVGRMASVPRGLFLLLWLGLSTHELLTSAAGLQKPGNQEMAAALENARCTTVVATGLTYATVLFYEMAGGEGAQVLPYPIDVANHPGNLNPERYSAEELVQDAEILVRAHPPGPGVCIVAANETFRGPLAGAYTATGATPREIGVFNPSLMKGTPYVIVGF